MSAKRLECSALDVAGWMLRYFVREWCLIPKIEARLAAGQQ
jgi:hypothetical protein